MDENNGNGKWIDGDEAIDIGLIDEVYEPMKAAASFREQMKNYNTARKSFGDRLPDLPESKTKKQNIMSDDKKSLREMFNEFKTEIVDSVKGLLNIEDDKLPEEITNKLTEFDTRIKASEDADEAIETGLQNQVDDLTENLETANTSITDKDGEIETLKAEKVTLEGKLTKAEATSTKLKGPKGQEDTGGKLDPEMEALDKDAAKLRAEHSKMHMDDSDDQPEDTDKE